MCFFFRWYNYYLASLILVNLDSRCYGFPVFAFRSRWLITKVISVCVLVIHRQSFVALTSDLSLSLARTQHNTTKPTWKVCTLADKVNINGTELLLLHKCFPELACDNNEYGFTGGQRSNRKGSLSLLVSR